MRIAAYCRVSTDKEEQLDSLQHQKEFFLEYAKRNGHQLYQLYADAGISGVSLKKRDAFHQLMRDAELGLFDLVVVKDISRFARNTVDALQSIRALKAMGIHTLFLTANMDTMGDSEFIITLFSAMAQEESNNLSKRVKFGKKINAEKGRVPQRLFGYNRIDKFTLEINHQEAKIVRKIFSLYIHQGLGCRTISMELNRANHKTKYGMDWNARAVRRVLVNPIYAGVLVNHKYEIEDFLTGKQIPIPADQHFRHARPEWAIIPPETFQQAQAILDARRIQYRSGEPFTGGRYSSKHTFSTLIKCAHCGRSFTRKTYTYANTRVYWRCVTNDQYTAEKCGNRVALDEAALLAQLRAYFSTLIENQEAFITHVLSGLEAARPRHEDPEAARKNLLTQKEKLLSKKRRYQDLYANELLSMEELKSKTAEINESLAALEASLTQVTPSENTATAEEARRRDREAVRQFLSLETVTNMDLRQLIDHISVTKDGHVQIVLNPFPGTPA